MHMSYRKMLTGMTLAVVLVLTSGARAATVGLWLFDGGPADVNVSDGTAFGDSSGNNLDFVYHDEYGHLTLNKVHYGSDVPAAIGMGTSLSVPSGLGRVIDTPSTDLLHPSKTGQLTVEFWHKGLSYTFGNVLGPVSSISPGGGGQEANRWQISTGMGNLGNPSPTGFEYDLSVYGTSGGSGNRTRATTGPDWPVEDVWKHVAVTTNHDTGELFIYVNGVEKASATGLVAQAVLDAPLRLLNNAATTNFNGHALVDEMRISDVALLPGDGSGNGVLAWNTSLVPEPTALGLLVAGGLMILGRRR
jgi:hypothetical protein